jgi:AraC-like DNA-binding protein
VLKTIAELGLDIHPYLEYSGLDHDDLNHKERQVPYNIYKNTLIKILDEVNVPALGLLEGDRWATVELGIVGYALFSSANLGTAIDRYIRYQDLCVPIIKTHLLNEEDKAILRGEIVTPEFQADTNRIRYAVEQAFVQWANLGTVFNTTKHWFEEVHFSFPEPRYSELYSHYFGCPVKYDQPFNEFLFPHAYLDLPLQFANEDIARLCEQRCASLVKELTEKEGLVQNIYRMLAINPGCPPHLPQIAKHLYMSERTLRRRLADEGTSFQQIVQNFRLELAREYLLTTKLPISEISDLVGYSEPANFHRAFCKRYSVTPNRFRRRPDTVTVQLL